MSEYQGKSQKEQDAVKLYRDTLAVSVSYCRPYFEKAVRFYRLFRGILPPEIDGTFSKVMLNFAWSMIENEVSKSLRSVLTNPQWFDVEAEDPSLEFEAANCRKWLKYQMEHVQRLAITGVPTIQATHIFGTGYRIYSHKFKNKKKSYREESGSLMGIPIGFRDKTEITRKSIISGQYADFFTVFPIPGGGQVNSVDDSCSSVVKGLIWVDYMGKKDIEALAKENPRWNKQEIGRLFERKITNSDDVTSEFHDKLSETDGGWYNFRQPEWLNLYDKDNGLDRQYRVGWMWLWDRWIVCAEDEFLLYDGPPMIDDCIPLAKFTGSFDLNEWFGIGLIEMTEDLILSILLNLNHRLDYLAGTLHPTSWVSQRVMDALGGDKSALDPEPYGANVFPNGADIQRELYRERFPDISQQAFIEDDKMQNWLQMVTGQPNYSNGPASQAPDNATGIISLIAEGAARSYLRAINIENTGLQESLWLTLKFGTKYKSETEFIRAPVERGAWPWMAIPADAIDDGYALSISGTRDMNLQAETFRRMALIMQTIVATPGLVANPKEAMRQYMSKSSSFDRVDEIVGQDMPEGAPAGMPPMGEPGQPSEGNPAANQMASTMNRTTVQPSTGEQVQVM